MDFKPDRYDKMQYRSCGKWGLKLPVISLGGWYTIGGYEPVYEAKKCIYAAFDNGITHFDFANNYGIPAGNGEIVGGQILRDLPRDEIIISSKAGYYMWPGPYGDWGSRKYIIASCEQSLKRMNIEYFDIFYIHRPDSNTPLEETHGALETLIQQGKVLYGGVSSYPAEITRLTIELKEKKNWFPLTIHQPAYNMFYRWIEEGLIQCAAENGFGIICFSPLAQGLLSNKYLKGMPADSRFKIQNQKGPDELQHKKISALNDLAIERGQSLAQMALSWVLRWKEVTSVLTAASKVEQLYENLKILENLEFGPDELKQIDTILAWN
jgi:L-glyceraldehyde 3-phosphate reductase